MKNLIAILTFTLISCSALFGQIRVDNGGSTLLKYGTFSPGNDAVLYLGDYNHYIKSKFGYGLSIGTYGSAEAIRIPQFAGRIGIFREPSFTLDINGTARATAYYTFSDKRFKQNIADCKEKSLLLETLQPVTYNLNNDVVGGEEKSSERMRYGFIAQDLQKTFPELVVEDTDGYLSVDYISFIPLLVEMVNQQSAEIEVLKSALQARENVDLEVGEAYIAQNIPNPFQSDTKIDYFVPNGAKKAAIHVYDLQGLQKKVIPLNAKGKASAIIHGGEFKAGMYLYSLIVDGKLIETKRMVLTD